MSFYNFDPALFCDCGYLYFCLKKKKKQAILHLQGRVKVLQRKNAAFFFFLCAMAYQARRSKAVELEDDVTTDCCHCCVLASWSACTAGHCALLPPFFLCHLKCVSILHAALRLRTRSSSFLLSISSLLDCSFHVLRFPVYLTRNRPSYHCLESAHLVLAPIEVSTRLRK